MEFPAAHVQQQPLRLKHLGGIIRGIVTSMREHLGRELAIRDARIADLESRSSSKGCTWAGVFVAGRAYAEGSLCTKKGGLWLAMRATQQPPGTDPLSWKLVVRSGQAGE